MVDLCPAFSDDNHCWSNDFLEYVGRPEEFFHAALCTAYCSGPLKCGTNGIQFGCLGQSRREQSTFFSPSLYDVFLSLFTAQKTPLAFRRPVLSKFLLASKYIAPKSSSVALGVGCIKKSRAKIRSRDIIIWAKKSENIALGVNFVINSDGFPEREELGTRIHP